MYGASDVVLTVRKINLEFQLYQTRGEGYIQHTGCETIVAAALNFQTNMYGRTVESICDKCVVVVVVVVVVVDCDTNRENRNLQQHGKSSYTV